MLDRDKVIEAFTRCGTPGSCSDRCAYFAEGFNCYRAMKHDLLELLKEQPEQKHGHWILDPNGMDWNLRAWVCSECHGRNDNLPLMDGVNEHNVYRWAGSQYCPCCGAKMGEEVKQE